MFYVGSKTKIADTISEFMLDYTDLRDTYYEPFCGSCAVAKRMAPNFKRSVLSDVHPDLILMYQALQTGEWTPGGPIDKESYYKLKEADPSPDRCFYGFSASFGSKWYDQYQDPDGRRVRASGASLLRDFDNIKNSEFINQSYVELQPEPGSVVYCDPPYRGTTMGPNWPKWDALSFWRTANNWAKSGVRVFVSEFSNSCPWPDTQWAPVWTLPRKSSQGPQGRPEVVETLFTYIGD